MSEDKHQYVLAQLEKRKELRQLSTVAKKADVSRRVIGYLMQGRPARTTTIERLYFYLKANARVTKLEK